MSSFSKQLFISLMSTSLLLASSISYAKQVEIGIAAIATDTSVVGKGQFSVNDTIDEGDSLKTGEKGTTTILFNDESMMTLGPNAHISVEVYNEGKNGKTGRSIIRVHKGQFRYFPGSILENGGSQFVAVGNKLLGKSAIPAQVNRQNGDNKDNRDTNSSQHPKTENRDRSQAKPVLTASNEGSDTNDSEGGTTGTNNGPPPAKELRHQAQNNTMANSSGAGNNENEAPDSSDNGGGISGIVNASAQGSSMAPPSSDDSPSSDNTGSDTSSSESTTPTVAAIDSDTSSGGSDSESGDSSDSSSSSSRSSTGTTTNAGVDSSFRDTGQIVVAIAGSVGGAGTGGTGGGNQNCTEDCSGGGGNIPFPGSNGIGSNPGETVGIGNGNGFGPDLGGNSSPGISGGNNPSPLSGGNSDFFKTGITGNVTAGIGNFKGAVDVFNVAGKDANLLGSLAAGQSVGLQLGTQTAQVDGTFGKGSLTSVGRNIGVLSNVGSVAKDLGNLSSVASAGKDIGNLGSVVGVGKDLGNIGSVAGVGKDLGNIGSVAGVGKDLGSIGSIGNIGKDIGVTTNIGGIGNIGKDIGVTTNIGSIGNIGKDIGVTTNIGGIGNIGNVIGSGVKKITPINNSRNFNLLGGNGRLR